MNGSNKQTDMYTLDSFKGSWMAVPNALLYATTPNEFTILATIIASSRVAISNKYTCVSVGKLVATTGMSKSTIKRTIKNLESLNLIWKKSLERKKMLLCINWEEVYFITETIKGIQAQGIKKLKTLCRNHQITPVSKLSEEVLDELKSDFGYTKDFLDTEGGTGFSVDPAGFSVDPDWAFSEKIVDNSDIPIDKDQKDLGKKTLLGSQRTQLGSQRTQSGSTENPAGSTENPDWVHSEPSIINIDRNKKEDVSEISDFRIDRGNEVSPKEEGSKNISEGLENSLELSFEHSCKSPKENKENFKELSKSFLLKSWITNRDTSFPAYSKKELQEIFESSEECKLKYDRAVQATWGSFQYKEEIEGEEYFPEDNYIPVDTYKEILFHAWSELNEQHPEWSLTEQEMKNIFCFDVVETEDDLMCVISPSSIKNLTQVSKTEEEFDKDNITPVKGEVGRLEREEFIETIKEVGEEDLDSLTNAEYAIWLMIEFVDPNSHSEDKVMLMKDDKLTRTCYEKFVSKVSKLTDLSPETIKNLWRDLPQRDKVTLRPTRISPRRIFKFNLENNQQSLVETRWKEKVEEGVRKIEEEEKQLEEERRIAL